jgi:hypothetical protein
MAGKLKLKIANKKKVSNAAPLAKNIYFVQLQFQNCQENKQSSGSAVKREVCM